MRILYLLDHIYLHGGAERILSQKINHLISKAGHEVFLLTTQQNGKMPIYELHPKLVRQDLGINYQREKSYFHPVNVLKAFTHFRKLKKAIATIKPSVIVSVSVSPEQYFLPYIYTEIPKIKEFHSSRFNFTAGKLKAKLEESLAKYAALVVLNLDEVAFFKSNNVVVIPNFTEFHTVDLARLEKEETVIAAGRIAPVKQFEELAHIWKMISSQFPGWTLKIFGDGETNAVRDLKALIKELDLQAGFLVLPATENMRQEMEKASVYAMTSATECFPMVLLEAKATGLPVVSYDCPTGPRHIVKNENDGYLVPLDNREAFAKKLSGLMEGESLRQAFAANAIANAGEFSKEKVMAQWQELFETTTK